MLHHPDVNRILYFDKAILLTFCCIVIVAAHGR